MEKDGRETFTKNSEKWVLVLYTGGTIGMKPDSNGDLIPQKDFFSGAVRQNSILNDVEYTRKKRPRDEENLGEPYALPLCKNGKTLYYIYEYPELKDSCNINAEDLKKMANSIYQHYRSFDGFVIVHGTDTMAYTASALSFMLENLSKPVILTGSQITLAEIRSDGTDNLLGAIFLAGNYNIPEVTLFFHQKLFRGNRVSKMINNQFGAFHSPNFDPLVRMEVDIIVNENYRALTVAQEFRVHVTDLECHVGLLWLYPSITLETVRSFLQPPMQGVVLKTYGNGNGPSDRKELLQEFEKATKRGVLILNSTQCPKGVVIDSYETGNVLIEAGVIPGHDITSEAALAKLGYILGKSNLTLEEQKKMLESNLRGEICVK